MTLWDVQVAHMRESFVDSLVARGFAFVPAEDDPDSDDMLRGTDFEVHLGSGFPFAPPKVRTLLETPASWHLDNEGFLCLYTSEGTERLPWLDVDGFLERVKDWFKWNDAGWPDDAPVLDLEQYLNLDGFSNIVVHEDLSRLDGDYIALDARQGGFWRVVGPGKAPKKGSRKRHITGFVTSIGEVETPPRCWEDLLARCPPEDQRKIQSATDSRPLKVILVRYRRADQHGCLALWFETPTSTPATLKAVSADLPALRLRSGTDADLLKTKHVYLIGAGAVGSNIADLLNRAGIGTLTIRDYDRLLPGNLVRHAVGFRSAHGLNKAVALSQWLRDAEFSSTRIVPVQAPFTDPAEVLPIFQSCDLVIDATADGAVTRMLTDAATTAGSTFLSACTKAEGHVLRADIIPPLNGAVPLPDEAPQGDQSVAQAVYEQGCGDPVSRTPPYAVSEVASMAVRHAVALLKGVPLSDSGEVREW